MGHLSRLLLGLLLILSLTACASKTAELLKSRVGQMNFEEAIQRFGPPTQCAEAGVTKACLWVYGPGGVTYVPMGRSFIPVPMEPPTLRLIFINGTLSTYEVRGDWE